MPFVHHFCDPKSENFKNNETKTANNIKTEIHKNNNKKPTLHLEHNLVFPSVGYVAQHLVIANIIMIVIVIVLFNTIITTTTTSLCIHYHIYYYHHHHRVVIIIINHSNQYNQHFRRCRHHDRNGKFWILCHSN